MVFALMPLLRPVNTTRLNVYTNLWSYIIRLGVFTYRLPDFLDSFVYK